MQFGGGMKRTLALTAVLFLGGCAIAARHEVESKVRDCNVLMSDPSLDSLRSRTPLWDIREVTVPMLAHEQKATDEERLAIELWSQKMVECRKSMLVTANQYYGQNQVALLQSAWLQTDTVIAQLYSGQITWAQSNLQRARLLSEFTNAAIATDKSQATASQAIGQALKNYGATVYGPEATKARQVQINPVPTYQPPPPSNIQCTTNNGVTNCRTY